MVLRARYELAKSRMSEVNTILKPSSALDKHTDLTESVEHRKIVRTEDESSSPRYVDKNRSCDAEIKEIKAKTAQLKSSITRLTSKINAAVKVTGSCTHIRELVRAMEDRFKDNNLCNRQLYRLLPEREHDAVGRSLVFGTRKES